MTAFRSSTTSESSAASDRSRPRRPNLHLSAQQTKILDLLRLHGSVPGGGIYRALTGSSTISTADRVLISRNLRALLDRHLLQRNERGEYEISSENNPGACLLSDVTQSSQI
jgi:hypothetical protein